MGISVAVAGNYDFFNVWALGKKYDCHNSSEASITEACQVILFFGLHSKKLRRDVVQILQREMENFQTFLRYCDVPIACEHPLQGGKPSDDIFVRVFNGSQSFRGDISAGVKVFRIETAATAKAKIITEQSAGANT
jgi:hypothetical protein